MKYSSFIFLLLYGMSTFAGPNAVININVHYDAQHKLIPPDKFLLRKALESYQKGFHGSALTKFKQAAAFGNSDAQRYVGLMYLKGLGVTQNWATGYAWIKLAAQDQTKKNIQLSNSVYSQLNPNEINLSESEYVKINTQYNQSVALKRRDRWAQKQRLKFTGSRTGSQIGNLRSYNDLRDLNRGSLASVNSAEKTSREIEKFVNNYNFGIIISGEIVPQDDKGNSTNKLK